MEIKILNEEKNKIEFEIENEDHTLCNALKDALWRQPNVEVAAYSRDHPLVDKVRMMVAISKGDVRNTISKAVEELKKQAKSMKASFSKC